MKSGARLPRRRLGIRRVGAWAALGLLSVLAVWIADATGVVSVLDGRLRTGYYGLSSPYAPNDATLLVAADEETVAAWGPPPWTWERLDELLREVYRAEPRLVAVVSRGPRVLPTGPLLDDSTVAYALRTGDLLLPPQRGTYGQPQVVLPPRGPVEAVALAGPGDPAEGNLTARLLARLGVLPPPGSGETAVEGPTQLAVNYLGDDVPLPTVPAHRVARGEIPPQAFRGRVVLFGLTALSFVDAVPTPLGPLTPAEIHAHAVRSVLAGLGWRPVAGATRWALNGAVALLLVAFAARVRGRRALLAAAGASAAIVGLDFVLFSHYAVLWGAGGPVTAVAAATIVGQAVRHRRTQRTAQRLAQLVDAGDARSTLADEVLRGGSYDDERAFWRHLAQLNRLYLDVEGALLAEVPEGRWHVEIRAGNGVRADDVRERRRDVRRAPYRQAWLTLRPVWDDLFMRPELDLKTLIVPLAGAGRLLGFWILNVPQHREFGAQDEAMVEVLAEQLSVLLLRRRLEAGPATALGTGRRPPPATTDRTLRALAQRQRRMGAVVEQLPLGVLVATLWGEIQLHNGALDRVLAGHGAQSSLQGDLADVLVALTGFAREDALAAMRAVVFESPSLAFRGRAPTGGSAAPHDIVLSRVSYEVVAPGEELAPGEVPAAVEGLEAGEEDDSDGPPRDSARARSGARRARPDGHERRSRGSADGESSAPDPLAATRFLLTVTPGRDAEAAALPGAAPLPGAGEAPRLRVATRAPAGPGHGLGVLVRGALMKARHALPAATDLRMRLPADIPAVQGDPALLVDALASLVNAACQLTPSAPTCTISADVGLRDVHLTITNPGHVFPPKSPPSLLLLDASQPDGGAPLPSLATASGCLEASGAVVDVTSHPEEGTTFTVRLLRTTPAGDEPAGS